VGYFKKPQRVTNKLLWLRFFFSILLYIRYILWKEKMVCFCSIFYEIDFLKQITVSNKNNNTFMINLNLIRL